MIAHRENTPETRSPITLAMTILLWWKSRVAGLRNLKTRLRTKAAAFEGMASKPRSPVLPRDDDFDRSVLGSALRKPGSGDSGLPYEVLTRKSRSPARSDCQSLSVPYQSPISPLWRCVLGSAIRKPGFGEFETALREFCQGFAAVGLGFLVLASFLRSGTCQKCSNNSFDAGLRGFRAWLHGFWAGLRDFGLKSSKPVVGEQQGRSILP